MIRTFFFFLFILILIINSNGQSNDTIKHIQLPFIRIEDSVQPVRSGSKRIDVLSHHQMKETASLTLAEALTDLQGVSQLRTGPISKPVIRGLYGNRLQVNLGGLKLEDQQWEDEQGLALSEVGVKRVEVIKGPAAILYGSDAIGGVIRIVDDEVDTNEIFNLFRKSKQNLNLELFSNTYGFGLDYGLQKRVSQHKHLIFNVAIESHADYTDGKGQQAPNTRFALYNLKLGYNYKKGKWVSENRLYAAYNQFGFIKDTLEFQEIKSEGRWSREFEDEHVNVFTLVFSNRNVYKINETTDWNSTLGWQSNIRQEQEGENETELGLSLHTLNLQSTIEKRFKHELKWISGAASMLQFNSNFGSRFIIPNATLFDIGIYSYLNKTYTTGRLISVLEGGIRYDLRSIHSLHTTNPDDLVHPFAAYNHQFNAFNYSIGGSFNYDALLVKMDISSGYRNPNLAELFSNGRHEGTDRWDLGKLNMISEFAFNKELFIQYRLSNVALRASIFSNHIKNFIFISPSSGFYKGYPIFRYDQADVVIKGFESGVEWSNHQNVTTSIEYSFLDSRMKDGSWLPFTPANRLSGKIKLQVPGGIRGLQHTQITFRSTYTDMQNHVAENEARSPSYWLHAIHISTEINRWRIMLTCNNLTNTYYNDHLSLLKQIGIRDIGRNIVLNAGITF